MINNKETIIFCIPIIITFIILIIKQILKYLKQKNHIKFEHWNYDDDYNYDNNNNNNNYCKYLYFIIINIITIILIIYTLYNLHFIQ